MAPFESLCMVSYSHSILTIALTCIILEIKRDIGRKSQFFSYPLAFDALVWGSLSEYCHVWYGKTRMVGLPDGEKILRICSAVLTEYRHVTDEHLATA